MARELMAQFKVEAVWNERSRQLSSIDVCFLYTHLSVYKVCVCACVCVCVCVCMHVCLRVFEGFSWTEAKQTEEPENI